MRRVMKSLVVMTLFCLPLLMYGQYPNDNQNEKPAKIWYFGENAGIDFSSGVAQPLTNGALASFEGCATISDNNGQLLFYTNGGSLPYPGKVWNRMHVVMPNGDLTNAGGCNSSFQSSLILKHPRQDSLYYLFTTDCVENNSAGGLRYNIIDMNSDGGYGDVVVKGQLLTTPVNESITAIEHANRQDWWIIVHKVNTDSFYVYQFTGQGIIGVVKQKIGPVAAGYAGALSASTNGERLCYSGLNWTALFNFNNATGEISNYINLNIQSYSNVFSPNCRYLYLANGVQKQIYQYDVLASEPQSSGILVGSTSSIGFGNLQAGPDGKIYCARFMTSPYLGVINHPNYRGQDCDYVDNGFYLAGKMSKAGLPNFGNRQIGECYAYPNENYVSYNGSSFFALRLRSHSTTLAWDDDGNASGYRIMKREVGKTDWEDYYTDNTSIQINGLDPLTKYEFVLQPIYSNGKYVMLDHYTSKDLGYAYDDATDNNQDNRQKRSLKLTTLNEFDFGVYPNPARSYSKIKVNLTENSKDFQIIITDGNGNVVKTIDNPASIGYHEYNVDLNDFANGIYHVSLKSGDIHKVEKLVVMK